ncbi:MAG: 6-pyruvoyl tetrahydrobiopterin synthase [Candidatus Omnitrophica bacterium CG11_big_fil_rev_8_21_14_0_20_45_26]|uniref:6-carboxy-5,6,7,8-tetrahydropterin synthase n=1 Tax=Candidatus Abzuiibacterium crystallinum TaxID=1974748 RepID=A0A2H0LKT4_9BACT|nr:MAG: 6-pyruvoyl tetrahydrobiopterin synthase [Candidatus Omnitrophica bacterium CG11_big_fil_rev_8_21_14_0_20_45_26]PIW63893.1 MAG: 6-pyruvoyl tetrahydrobiopterin synthase [Candidatus Omnitrophica bacterium CG12_big_fil_rev_8_21_14_0_65_45_16]
MYSVTKEIHFCYGHRLMNYEGKCRHLHGHNGRVQVKLTSSKLDHRAMVFDFADISREIKTWIDETLDHTMLLREDDPILPHLKEKNERFLTMKTNPTAEAIARMIYDHVASLGFPIASVTLWETETSFATYQASVKKP